MKKMILFNLLSLLMFSSALVAQNDIVGFWKSVDEKTQKPQSLVAIYEYKGKYYGRLIITYDEDGKVQDTFYAPKIRAPGIQGNPFYAGMDIIYELKKNGDKYTEGEIVDPEKGNIYDAELWVDKGNLIVRGELSIFGRNQTWPPAQNSDFPQDFKKPDLKKLVPVIPKVKI